ncbi:MAG: phosphatidate cytidylyltransferase, partial [Clostridiales bacterium]|nr:phosphatidate cytidylyltransferase [Clostridiales bacterium]
MFWTRLLSSIGLVIIALITIIAGGPVLLVTLFVVSVTAFMELSRAVKIHGEKPVNSMEIAGILSIFGLYLILYFVDNDTIVLMFLLMVLVLFMSVYVIAYPKYHANQVMAGFFSFVYAPVMLSCIYKTRNLEMGIYIVWMIFISSWINDTCAYLVGITIGKHKLSPKLSPKKSIEGSLGGILGAGLAGGLFGWLVVAPVIEFENLIPIFAAISMIGAVIAQIGDLAASGIKRNHEI